MRTRTKVLVVSGAAVLLLLVGGIIGFAIDRTLPRDLGGIDVQAACSQQFPGSKAVVNPKANVYGWRCYGTDHKAHGVNLNKQCVVQYGSGAVATYSDFNNPLSWHCRR